MNCNLIEAHKFSCCCGVRFFSLLFLLMAHRLRIRYAAGRHQQQNDKKKLSDNCTAYCDVNFAWSASK